MEIAVVRVPVVMINGHAADTGRFDASRRAIRRPLAERRPGHIRKSAGFRMEIERFRSRLRGDEFHRFLLEHAELPGFRIDFGRVLETIHLPHHFPACRQSLRVDMEWRQQVGHTKPGRIRIGIHHERAFAAPRYAAPQEPCI